MKVGVCVDVAETCADRIVDEEKIRKLVPGAIVEDQVIALYAVRSYLHQCTILRAAAWAAVQPDYCSLTIRDMLVLEMPEEEISIVLRVDLDMPVDQEGLAAAHAEA